MCTAHERRPVNTAVASPEPSETTTSSAGMPERGLIRTCLISPLMRTGQRMGQCLIFVTSRLSKRTWSRSASRLLHRRLQPPRHVLQTHALMLRAAWLARCRKERLRNVHVALL